MTASVGTLDSYTTEPNVHDGRLLDLSLRADAAQIGKHVRGFWRTCCRNPGFWIFPHSFADGKIDHLWCRKVALGGDECLRELDLMGGLPTLGSMSDRG
jgi:hypothetical protein